MNKTIDLSHLNSLELRLSHERTYLTEAKTKKEKELRKIWITQIEKEIENEKKFLGINNTEEIKELSDDDLLSELF